jgi:hypothetical protein
MSYLIIRNTVDLFREKYSCLFNWLGKISLELFVCSYHIWLAADSKGVLVLLPGLPVVNTLITSLILICICYELNLITKILGYFFVPSNDWKICLRNFFAFIIIVLPIGIKYGYI